MSTLIDDLREQFPALGQNVYGRKLVYFDNAATSQRLRSVLDLQSEMSIASNANIHRAVHYLSSKATDLYEESRLEAVRFLNAPGRENIVFTSGTTAAINMVASGFAWNILKKGDKVLISEAEHHSNLVPWQIACQRSGATLEVIKIDENGRLNLQDLENHLDSDVKLAAIAHVANVVGVYNHVEEIIKVLHNHNIPVLLDGAQGVTHRKVDVQTLDCDFYVFSGHKIFGPTGTGVLYGKKEWLEALPPYMGGGDMVGTVTFEHTTYAPLPLKFEAGTPNFIGIAALAPALRFASALFDNKEVQRHEKLLIEKMETVLKGIDGLTLVGGWSSEIAEDRTSLFSFKIDGVHPEDAAQILDKQGVAVRSGLMCSEPIVRKYSQSGLLRASLLFYNTEEEIDLFADALARTVKMLG